MSLYYCIDLLEKKKNRKRFFAPADEHDLVTFLHEKLSMRIETDSYENLDEEIDAIEEHQEKYHKLPHYLKKIYEDLIEIRRAIRCDHSPDRKMADKADKYEAYKIAWIRQYLDFRFGNSDGECFGYAYAMVDPKISPYLNKNIRALHLNKEIYNYQNNQLHIEPTIKKKRLIMRRFCPDMTQRAQELYNLASRNKGEDFLVTLHGKGVGHAVYIHIQEDSSIRYMDSNHGAYLFENQIDLDGPPTALGHTRVKTAKAAFFNFFKDTYTDSSENSADYFFPFYSVSQITYDATAAATEKKTFKGKIRTLLTGEKYGFSLGAFISSYASMFLLLALAAVLSAPLLILAPPLFEPIVLLFFFGFMILDLIAAANGFKGILGIPQYLLACLSNKQTYEEKDQCEQNEMNAENGLTTTISKGLIFLSSLTQITEEEPEKNSPNLHYSSLISSAPSSQTRNELQKGTDNFNKLFY